ncbi:hypothetical protein pb186bvf_012011 [Paramecium bursaria]
MQIYDIYHQSTFYLTPREQQQFQKLVAFSHCRSAPLKIICIIFRYTQQQQYYAIIDKKLTIILHIEPVISVFAQFFQSKIIYTSLK